jgi:hypothetical protein
MKHLFALLLLASMQAHAGLVICKDPPKKKNVKVPAGAIYLAPARPEREVITCDYAGPDLCKNHNGAITTLAYTHKFSYSILHSRSLVIQSDGSKLHVLEVQR